MTDNDYSLPWSGRLETWHLGAGSWGRTVQTVSLQTCPQISIALLTTPKTGNFSRHFLSTLLHKLFPLHLESNIFLMILRDLQFASTQFLTNMRVKWYNRYSQEVKPFNPRYAHCWRFFLSYKWIRSIYYCCQWNLAQENTQNRNIKDCRFNLKYH